MPLAPPQVSCAGGRTIQVLCTAEPPSPDALEDGSPETCRVNVVRQIQPPQPQPATVKNRESTLHRRAILARRRLAKRLVGVGEPN